MNIYKQTHATNYILNASYCKVIQIGNYTRFSITTPHITRRKPTRRRLLDKGDVEVENTFIQTKAPSNVNRTKRLFAEYCLLNRPTYFGTLTFSDTAMAKYENTDEMIKNFKKKLKNLAYNYKDFRMLYVFEYGKKNGRIHVHFIGDIPDNLIRINKNNYPEIGYFAERFGFTQMEKINDTEKDYQHVSGYVSKYITKDCLKVGNRYFHKVGNFLKPEMVQVNALDVINALPELFKITRKTKNGDIPVIQNHRYCISGWGFFKLDEIVEQRKRAIRLYRLKYLTEEIFCPSPFPETPERQSNGFRSWDMQQQNTEKENSAVAECSPPNSPRLRR